MRICGVEKRVAALETQFRCEDPLIADRLLCNEQAIASLKDSL
jgi:hypothetical protein